MTLTPFTRMAAVTRFPEYRICFWPGTHFGCFLKTHKDHAYYQASAPIDAFMATGEEALTFAKAVNGAGDSNILSDAVDLLPLQPKPISDITLDYVGTDQVSIDFGRSLSSYGRLPRLDISQRGKALQLAGFTCLVGKSTQSNVRLLPCGH